MAALLPLLRYDWDVMVQRLVSSRQLARLSCGAVIACCIGNGCQTSGFEQLTDTAPRNVFFPGTSLGMVSVDEVPFEILGMNGLNTAVVTRDPSSRLHVHAFDGRKPCAVGPIAPLDDPIERTTYNTVDRFLPYQVRVDVSNTSLHVMDDHCREPLGPYPNGKVIGNPVGYLPTSVVVLTEDHRLLRLEPETSTELVIAKMVHAAVQTSNYLFTLEEGTVTIRDRKLATVVTVGDGVIDMRVDNGNERVAFIDNEGLSVVPSPTEAAVHVDKSACYVDWADAPSEVVALQYEASCTDRTLVVNAVRLKKRLKLPKIAKKPVALRNFGDQASPDWVLSYFAKSEDTKVPDPVVIDPSGTPFTALRRFIGRLDEPAVEVGLARTVRSISPVSKAKVFLWLDPGTEASRLIAWSPELQSVYLRHVTDFSTTPTPMRALVEKGNKNDLMGVEPDQKPQRLIANAYNEGKRGTSGILLFSNTTNDIGQVSFLSSHASTPEELFSSAYVPSASLIWDEVAVSSLTQYSVTDRRGELCVRLLESADTFCQPNVVSYAPTYRPALGISYVARNGANATLHWAEAR